MLQAFWQRETWIILNAYTVVTAQYKLMKYKKLFTLECWVEKYIQICLWLGANWGHGLYTNHNYYYTGGWCISGVTQHNAMEIITNINIWVGWGDLLSVINDNKKKQLSPSLHLQNTSNAGLKCFFIVTLSALLRKQSSYRWLGPPWRSCYCK